MGISKVYFCDMRADAGNSLLQKLHTLIDAAMLCTVDFKGKFVAIKIHFGEPGNLSFLRANYAKVVVDYVKKRGGKPFLTDCNTLYPGRRKNALEHLDAAFENGYSPFSTGCQIIIADGLKGTDEAVVPITDSEVLSETRIGRAIMDADIFISLNHFKAHECTGFGGAIKNTGMGSGSRAGKMSMHCNGKPDVDENTCVGCGVCCKNCGQDAITVQNKKAVIDKQRCVGCGRCIGACNFDAIYNPNNNSNYDLDIRMAEYAKAVVDTRPNFHINVVADISPYCDCHAENDAPIIPNIGMFASFDIVAVDKASADACLAAPVLEGSLLFDNIKAGVHGKDHFCTLFPDTNWLDTINHAVKIGLGNSEYEIIATDTKKKLV